jgi:hypothetical protein
LRVVSCPPHLAACLAAFVGMVILSKVGARLMGTFRDDPDFWRFHAEEVRIKSRQINDPGTKRAV